MMKMMKMARHFHHHRDENSCSSQDSFAYNKSLQHPTVQPHHRSFAEVCSQRFFFFSTTKVFTCSKVSLTIEVFTERFTYSKVNNAFKRQNSWTDPFRKSSTSFACIFRVSLLKQARLKKVLEKMTLWNSYRFAGYIYIVYNIETPKIVKGTYLSLSTC